MLSVGHNESQLIETLFKRIDPERLKQITLDMLRIPSPPGQERAVAEYYAGYLKQIGGLNVEMDREYPESPSVIGRLHGRRERPVLQLDGHLDTIAVPGPNVHFENGWIYGRGAEDMKSSLVAMAEAVRVIIDSGIRLKGSLLLTAHGLHESGTNESLEALIRKGIYGDAVIVAELGLPDLPIAGMGLALFEIRITREGEVVHELMALSELPNPLLAGYRLMQLLEEKRQVLTRKQIPHLGSESIFIGKFQSGDYFNRLPNECIIAGTRRYGPARHLDDIHAEFNTLAKQIAKETGTQVKVIINGNGLGSFSLAEDEPIVRIIRKAHAKVTGKNLGFTGIRTVGNVSNFVNSAKVPAVYYGPESGTAHSEQERVALDELVRVTKVYVQAILDYLDVGQS